MDRQTRYGAPARFRLLVKGPLIEVYLDDILIECHHLPRPATGRVGLIRGDQANSIRQLKAWQNSWQKALKDPDPPLVLREYKASPLQPPTQDIAATRPPRAGLVHLPVPFMTGGELADIRCFHGGQDGLLYLEASAKLSRPCQGSLSYGSDGPVKVWVNGHVVDCQPAATNPANIGKYLANVSWRKGLNRITFALATNHGRAWGITARVRRDRQRD